MKKYLLPITLIVVVCTITLMLTFQPQASEAGTERRKVVKRSVGLAGRAPSKIYSVILKDWEYWESVNSAEYEDAARDCRDNGDILMYMETKEAVGIVNNWLQDTDSTGTLYWVGGKYDAESGIFVWENGDPINSDAPWAPGEPKEKTANTRVAASTIGREILLRTEANSTALRYICKYL